MSIDNRTLVKCYEHMVNNPSLVLISCLSCTLSLAYDNTGKSDCPTSSLTRHQMSPTILENSSCAFRDYIQAKH